MSNTNDEKRAVLFPCGNPWIVLFIDNLDRRPPDKVMEMLEALQLLIKTELFVVVVAMDMRFVTLALEAKYKGILKAGGHPCGLDYVEKIIQLPYWLPPIEKETAMDQYIKAQMGKLLAEDGGKLEEDVEQLPPSDEPAAPSEQLYSSDSIL
jgi:hypothetical protein